MSTSPTLDDQILTTAQVSACLAIPEGTLKAWRHRRQGPRSFKLGDLVRYRRADVDEWLAAAYANTDRPDPQG